MRYAENFCKQSEDLTHYIYTGPCHNKCGKTITVRIPKEALYKYNQGGYIQEAMSMLSAGEREFLMSGICGDCFKQIFSREEE